MKRYYKIDNGRLIALPTESEINVTLLCTSSYRGSCLSHMDFSCQEDMRNYTSVAHIMNIHNRQIILPETIQSHKCDRHLEIVSPYVELESVGNELAMYLLLEHHILTLDAVSCLYNKTLILFIGKSNSGKTTSARLLKLQIPEVTIMSDDFTCLRRNNFKLEFSVPIWDILSDCSVQTAWHTIDHVVLVDLDKDFHISSFSDLFNYSIGSNFSSEISFENYKMLCEIKQLGFSREIFSAEYRNFDSIWEKLHNYLVNLTPL